MFPGRSMVGQGPLKPLILVRIQAREPPYLLTCLGSDMLMTQFRPYLLSNIYFTLSVSVISGISNASVSYWSKGLGEQESAIDLIHAFIGNSVFGLVANFIPSTFNVKYAHTSLFWLTGNLMMLGMNVLMLRVHYAIQTENPIETRIVPTFVSQSLENVFIFKMLMGEKNNK